MIRSLLFFALMALIVVASYLWVARVPTMERYLSKKLNGRVKIDEVHIRWEGLTLENLRLKNPSKSTLPYAFEAQSIDLEIPLVDLWKRKIHLHRVRIKDPILYIEMYNSSGSDNNWGRILNGFPSSDDKLLSIDHLSLTNLQFKAMRSTGKSFTIPAVPFLEFENLGYKKSVALNQIAKLMFESILVKMTHKPYLGSLLNQVKPMSKEMKQSVSGSYSSDEIKRNYQEGLGMIKKKTQEAKDFLQEFFSH